MDPIEETAENIVVEIVFASEEEAVRADSEAYLESEAEVLTHNIEAMKVDVEALNAFLELLAGCDDEYIDTQADAAEYLPDSRRQMLDWDSVSAALDESQRILVGVQQLLAATLADMSEEKAASSLANYMDNFTREIELDLDGWNKLSDADQAMLMAADHFANMGMDDLASIRDASGEELTLSDLFSGGKASLSKNPAAAIELLNQARKSVTAERAYLGVTMAMNQHSVNAMQAEHENLMRMESYIRDTDMAEAATELTRTNILQQTGMALLRTAQQQNRNIINLIDMTA